MGYIVFENTGEIDLRTIKTFGISVKETNNPIGFFGTGLKYAIAILMRHGLELQIQAGKQTFDFKKVSTEVRGKDFDMILMNDEELPFTTHLGVNWELWQAFRELYCNAKDEFGGVSLYTELPKPQAGKTRIVVRGDEFEQIFHDRETIVLNLPDSLKQDVPGVEIYDAPSEYLYYRGIRVVQLKKKSQFTYNVIDPTDLTEDRTVKYANDFAGKIHRKTASLKNKSWIKRILLASDNEWESEFYFLSLKYYMEEVSPEFKSVVGEFFRKNSDKCNKTAISFFAEISREESPKFFQPIKLDKVELAQLERAKEICLKMFHDFDEYKIKVVKTLGQSTMAMAVRKDDEMVLSRQCFDYGTKFLVSTMIEEYMHLKTGYDDMTRELQTHLFDTICTIAEKHVIGEAI